ncbi:MAG: ABC transporter permease [Zoogloeaceae bacterium]|jgi:peptide/nickel transport system permease protein|nr:ABC transporter permease [Zoogloeaceae bacterium]
MSVQLVLLWSDVLLWLLCTAALIFGWRSMRLLHLARGWAKLGKNPIATGTATLLVAFLLVGLTDSIHYREALPPLPDAAPDAEIRYGVEVFSALDYLLEPLRTQNEKTYSAPFATRLYAMESMETAAGISRLYPRLTYGGAHLDDEIDRTADIVKRLMTGVLLAFFLLAGIYVFSRRVLRKKYPGFAWQGVLAALCAIVLVFLPLFFLTEGYHVLGTDKVGQDVLYQALKSIRTALIIGLVTTLVMLPIAILLGIAAGYFRGWMDDLIQYLYTVLNSIPGVLLIAAAVLMMQVILDTHPEWFATAAERADLRLLALCMILGVTSWTSLARLLRGETMKLRELEYIEAARAFGVPSGRIVIRHILPNLMHIVIIALVMDFSALVLAEAVLSYIGIGVDPSTTSFGTMINNARMELSREPAVWWSLAAAFSFMFVLVLSANLFADAVRDAFDPRYEKRA